jgi:S1-C subfamily serine protease
MGCWQAGRHFTWRRSVRGPCTLLVALACSAALSAEQPDRPDTIQRMKRSVVAIGTYQTSRNPRFAFRGTGFAVDAGGLVATNAHVLPVSLDEENHETLVVVIPRGGTDAELRSAELLARDPNYDLAVLRVGGTPLPPVRLGDSQRVREGDDCLFTGFPIGTVLGLISATHRAMISALTPVALPTGNARELDARTVRRLSAGAYSVFQLDATAYPGNSGSPLYLANSGEVVGIINMVFVKGTKESALSAPSGISYAIPAQPLADLLDRLKQPKTR